MKEKKKIVIEEVRWYGGHNSGGKYTLIHPIGFIGGTTMSWSDLLNKPPMKMTLEWEDCPRTAECKNFEPKEKTEHIETWTKMAAGMEVGLPKDGFYKPTYSGVAVHTPTKEEWDRVTKHLAFKGLEGICGNDIYKTKTCILIDNHPSFRGIESALDIGYEIITVSEYFRRYGPERPEPKFKVGDDVVVISKNSKSLHKHKQGDKLHIVGDSEFYETFGNLYPVYPSTGWLVPESDLEPAPTASPEAIKALRESIEIWTRRAAGLKDDSKCPLCLAVGTCRYCPIGEKTGVSDCHKTPFGEWNYKKTPENARAMLNFLIELYEELTGEEYK